MCIPVEKETFVHSLFLCERQDGDFVFEEEGGPFCSGASRDHPNRSHSFTHLRASRSFSLSFFFLFFVLFIYFFRRLCITEIQCCVPPRETKMIDDDSNPWREASPDLVI